MYKVDDLLIGTHCSNTGIIIKVIKALEDGTYLWEYPDLPKSKSNEFWSGNSPDPALEFSWEIYVDPNMCITGPSISYC